MHVSRVVLLAALVPVALVASAPHAAAPISEAAVAEHVLNRVAFGARPGDVARVQAMGVERFIEEQLRPERIADEDIARRLSGFETLTLTSREIAERYALPAQAARREQQQKAGDAPTQPPPAGQPMQADPERRRAALPLMELSQQKLLRAAYSERQLQEVLADFWFNHFNVDARKGPVRFLLTEYERDVIRPHVLGRFRDLLGATATSPAMLFYLDNWMSADPAAASRMPMQRLGGARRQSARPMPSPPAGQQAQRQRPTGLNENYGRELLELHTLGVDGGYTQKDVTEVARAFTGWTIAMPRAGGPFRFAPQLHDDGDKVVLGRRIKAGGGQRDGEQVLDLLAAHPSTARFISIKLARRFVSDTPSPALVDRVTDTFRRTDGDLRAVMTTLLTAPEFLAPESRRSKVKTPFEFVVSAVRATGAETRNAMPLVRSLQELGMPLYQCQPPTGYRDSGDAWVSAGALVSRMNVALALASGSLPGLSVSSAPTPIQILGDSITDTTRATIARAGTPAQSLALALGSPEFQRR